MGYVEGRCELDLSSAGRGLQQTLLLLTHLHANPGSVLLLDEPDAHLEVLRQRQVYNMVREAAERSGSQVIAASHSEIVLGEAANRDMVIAFVGTPHRIDDRVYQARRALIEIGFDQYYLAEQRRWALYLESSTDLSILQAFARRLGHDASNVLDDPFVHYVGNQIQLGLSHHAALREAVPDLRAIAILDELPDRAYPEGFLALAWQRREIENYICQPETLVAYAQGDPGSDLFAQAEAESRIDIMNRLVRDRIPPIAYRDRTNEWWLRTKVTDEFLDPLFEKYFAELGLPNIMRKTNYHELVPFVPTELLDTDEIRGALDAVVRTVPGDQP